MEKGKIYIGTSGWDYGHWTGVFYPEKISGKEKLEFFSRHFDTVEINYSFYRLPAAETFENWKNKTPDGFIFSVKASRYITHIKRLSDVRGAWTGFLDRARKLEKKLGPILLQFPRTFGYNQENFGRLERFLSFKGKGNLKLAFEFRDHSWQNREVFKSLGKNNSAFVLSDSPRAPIGGVITAGFVYVRMHGGKELYGSKYSKKELMGFAEKIRKWSAAGLDSYIYFNNDASGYAVENAKDLAAYSGVHLQKMV